MESDANSGYFMSELSWTVGHPLGVWKIGKVVVGVEIIHMCGVRSV